jgi:hypothetical protein
MKHCVALSDWIGKRDDVALDPARLQFTTAPAGKTCRGCMFDQQGAEVCGQVLSLADRVGLANCDRERVIYVARTDIDPRQIDLIKGM